MSAESEIKIEAVGRRVIENKLLTALHEGDKVVAILASEQDLRVMIAALRAHDSPAARTMADAYGLLLRSAFPPPTMDEMAEALIKAGWKRRNATAFTRPDGAIFRGPAFAWHVMMNLPWPI